MRYAALPGQRAGRMTSEPTAGIRQPLWFLIALALAVAGGAVAYVPFLTVLLPLKVNELASSQNIEALSYITFAGAIFASLANIGFGWASDKWSGRRSWIAAGLLLSCFLLIAMGEAHTIVALMVLVIAWQLALNMMLAPLLAWAGDCVPDMQKGLLGGLFALAPAMGALAGTFVTLPGLADATERLWIIAALVALLVSPALALGGGRQLPVLMKPVVEPIPNDPESFKSRPAIIRMWTARLLVQIAEAALFAFLLFWLRSLSPTIGENTVANLFSAVLCVAVPIALVAGRWSDKARRPMLPLAICAALSALGLVLMALSKDIQAAILGYAFFGLASMTFLSLHNGQTLRVLPRPQNRGRDMGIFNLTNTVPSLIIPWLTLAMVPTFGFGGLFFVLAGLVGVASLLLAQMSYRR